MALDSSTPPIFPRWVDSLKPIVGGLVMLAPVYGVALVYYGGSPTTTDVGYRPAQPVAYSHALHAGELGLDCRYCHDTVEDAAHAAIPATETCMNCHAAIFPDSVLIAPVRESWQSGLPIPWIRVHDLPDYAYFDHSIHVRRGVGCAECHGRIDRMEVVYQAEPLSMGWCLDCHRDPAPRLRPLAEITNMSWPPAGTDRRALGQELAAAYGIRAPEDCSACHR
jgi:hypothetical protein